MKKDTFLASLFLLFSLVLTLLYIKPTVDADAELEAALREKEVAFATSESEFNELRSQKEQFDKLTEAEKEKAIKRVPREINQQTLIDELTALAQKNALTLTSVTFSKAAGGNDYRKITLVASFSNLTGQDKTLPFLESLETTDRLMTVRSLSLLYGQNRSDYTVTLEVYYRG